METKSIFTSKTFWLNGITLVSGLIMKFTGFEIDEGSTLAILGVINIILRAVTKTPVNWS